ncbi:MAG: ribbon-helix-helix protein, CopG family [Candidatus Limnocylindrales bacterium]|nr:ribbon-helix-helix protein, CopG family [Chloroflexota bacterium]
MNKTTLYLPDELHRRIRDLSRRTGRPQAELIRSALERYVEGERRPLPRSIGAGEDDHLSGQDSEDWLRRNWRP